MRFQATVAPAQRDCDVSKTGLACFLTRTKATPFGNGTIKGIGCPMGDNRTQSGRTLRELGVERNDASQFLMKKTKGTKTWAKDCGISFALSGLKQSFGSVSQGDALGYHILPHRGGPNLKHHGILQPKTFSSLLSASPAVGLRAPSTPGCRSNGRDDDPRNDWGLAGARPVQSDRTHEAYLFRKRVRGFTLIELLTLVGAMGILVTLGISTATSVRTSSRQVTCSGNLEAISSAINRYAEETGHRPRSLSRLGEAATGTNLSTRLICPSDPAVRGSGRTRDLQDLTWGNRANESQDPGIPSVVGEPESGSWQTELQERKETLPFSYLHPLGWTRSAWDRLRAQGPPFGTAVCQLHGVRVPAAPGNPNHRTYMEYEGRFLRAQTDGSVVRRKLFRDPDPQPGLVTTASPAPLDYPWEFYTDRNVPKLK